MEDHSYVIKHIQAILDEMHAMDPLAKIGSDAYHADHDTWTTQRERINEAERMAEIYAMLTVPPEIAVLLEQVRREWRRLRNVMPGNEENPNA